MILAQQLIVYFNMYLQDPQILILLGGQREEPEGLFQAQSAVDLEGEEANYKEEEVDLEEADAMAAGAIKEEGIFWEGLLSMIRTTIIITEDEITTMGLI